MSTAIARQTRSPPTGLGTLGQDFAAHDKWTGCGCFRYLWEVGASMDFEVAVGLEKLLQACRDAAAGSWGRIEVDDQTADRVKARYEGDNGRVDILLLSSTRGSVLRIDGTSRWENELRKMVLERVGAI